jgi:hypothetical protein
MITFSILTAVSTIGMSVIIARNLPRVRAFSAEELEVQMTTSTPVRHSFLNNLVVPACRGAQDYCVPRFYAIFEKVARRGRIVALKTETKLHKITNYLQGKRELSGSNRSEYWNTVNEYKNGGSAAESDVKEV